MDPIIDISSDEVIRRITESPAAGSKTAIMGPSGSGKTTLLMKRYRHLVEDLGQESGRILVLVLNKAQLDKWKSEMLFRGSSGLWAVTYHNFIQEELKTYYPLILKTCPDIEFRRLKPVFLGPEAAIYIMYKALENRRETKGVFAPVASGTMAMSRNLVNNLYLGAVTGIPFEQIPQRLYEALEAKDEVKRQIFDDVGKVLEAYVSRCMELGVFDQGLSVYLYNTYLLRNPIYIQKLRGRLDHLIADNVEEYVPAAVELIEALMPGVKSFMAACNPEGGCGRISGADSDFACRRLEQLCEIVRLDDSYTCSSFMYEFSDMLFDSIKSDTERKAHAEAQIERHPHTMLRSMMLNEAGERICELVHKEGFRPSDIAVISTYADTVTAEVLGKLLAEGGLELENAGRKADLKDNPYVHALITLARLCYPSYGLFPSADDLRVLFRLYMDCDPVRCSILAEEVCKQRNMPGLPEIRKERVLQRLGRVYSSRYDYLRAWVKDRISNPLGSMHAFLQKAFLELIAFGSMGQQDIGQVRRLLSAARDFCEAISCFPGINAGRGFLETVIMGLWSEIQDHGYCEDEPEDKVLFCTPLYYLFGGARRKVIVLLSLSSDNWYPRGIREISNIHVMSRAWQDGEICTGDIEEALRRNQLAALIRCVLKTCGQRLITFESNLSANGYENNGMLSECFDRLLEG